MGIDLAHDLVERCDFFLHLIFGTEDVPVILSKAAHPHHAVQRARRLIAMALTEFAVTQRQVAVAVQTGIENLDMARAISSASAHKRDFPIR